MALRRLGLLAVVLALALTPAVAGCGGDEESESEEWAGDVCTELSTWATSVHEAIRSLTGNPLSLDQDAVQAATEDVKVATDDLVDGLGDLEPFETEAGDQARTELDALGTQLQQQLDEFEQDAEAGSLTLATVTGALAHGRLRREVDLREPPVARLGRRTARRVRECRVLRLAPRSKSTRSASE